MPEIDPIMTKTYLIRTLYEHISPSLYFLQWKEFFSGMKREFRVEKNADENL